MKMTDFIKSKSVDKKIARLNKAGSKEERRKLEEQLFVPEELQPYTGELPVKKALGSKTVTMVFDSEEDIALLVKHVKISEYHGLNVRSRNLNILIDFFKAIDNGEIEYDRENRTFIYHTGVSSKVKRVRK